MMRFRIRRISPKILMVLAILLFCVFIKVGYAYLNQSLGMGGLALAPKNTWDVHFVDNSIVESENLNSCLGGDTCSRVIQSATIGQDGISVSFGVVFHVIGDYYEFTVDIVNNGSIDAMLNEVIKEGLSGNSNYLDFTVTYADGMPIAQYDQLLKDGGRETLKVKVTFIGTPEEDVNANLSVTVNYVQADSSSNSRSYNPEARIRTLNTLGTSIADDDPDHNLRFIGANPNNYVWFNNQKWRIIGVFDGRLKIIQDSIGSYAWDTSKFDINNKYGVNQWGPNNSGYTGAAIMKLLNPGYETNTDFKCKTGVNLFGFCNNNKDSDYTTGLVNNSLYWNASSGTCYNYGNYDVRACDFTSTGLSDTKSKNMIDNVTWYLGANSAIEDPADNGTLTANYLYNMERSNNNGKQCTEGGSCNDTVERTTTWQGKVGLMYPSDYAYATSGGNTYSRNDCLGYYMGYSSESSWKNTYTECGDNDWLLDKSIATWTITPGSSTTSAALAFLINKTSDAHINTIANAYSIRPTVYLKPGVVFTNEGDGTEATPFVLRDLSNVNTVTFDANGGNVSPTTRQVNGGNSIGTLPVPTATDKIFKGWYTSSTGGSKISSSYIPTGNITIYAHWTQIYDPETRIRALNTLNTSIADDDPDSNLRFIGANPNNYVSFNNQKWRIIGVFDGQLKIVQDSIGKYSWDTSKNDVNSGYGINQWGPNNSGYDGADLMKLLNPGYESNTDFMCKTTPSLSYTNFTISCGNNSASNYTTGLVNNSLYWNASSGKCYTYGNEGASNCDFTSTGLKDTKSKNMIDDATWYFGTYLLSEDPYTNTTLTVNSLYNSERSNIDGSQCSKYCTDTIERTTRWQGKVGLMYASDYVYATSGGYNYNRNKCLNYFLSKSDVNLETWHRNSRDCVTNNWIYNLVGANNNMFTLSIMPSDNSYLGSGNVVFDRSEDGSLTSRMVEVPSSILPTVYLKSNVKFINEGDGTKANPFTLTIID